MNSTLYLSQRIGTTWAQSYAFCPPNQVFQNEGLYGIWLGILQANHRETKMKCYFCTDTWQQDLDSQMTLGKEERLHQRLNMDLYFKLFWNRQDKEEKEGVKVGLRYLEGWRR